MDSLHPARGPGSGLYLDPATVEMMCNDQVADGECSWRGAAGTGFWIDPVEELFLVGMIQQRGSPFRPNVGGLSPHGGSDPTPGGATSLYGSDRSFTGPRTHLPVTRKSFEIRTS